MKDILTFFEHENERFALTTLFISNTPGKLYFCAAAYDDKGHWTGKEYSGYIPSSDLLAWAIEQGFVKEREL